MKWKRGTGKEEARVGKEGRKETRQADLTMCGMAEMVMSSGTWGLLVNPNCS